MANDWGTAQRYNALGRYDDALAASERVTQDPFGLDLSIWVLADLIEAAVRSDHTERARAPLTQLGELAQAAGTDWALGTYARAAAMLAEGTAAEQLYREAIKRLSRVHAPDPKRSPARTCSTASGSAASTAASKRGINCVSLTQCWPTWTPMPSPNARPASFKPPAKPSTSAPPRHSTS